MGYKTLVGFKQGLKETVAHFKEHDQSGITADKKK
jgi:hypothetical protein